MNKVSECGEVEKYGVNVILERGKYFKAFDGYYICTKIDKEWVLVSLQNGSSHSYKENRYDWWGWETLPDGYCIKIEVGG